ncbi:hypothetical protein [Nonomuraea bangladeshensis]|uniref:hypothetical protein n=1 Tax=Nonomuraea bangladeshensis TaxID=404385 RepID=UPI003C2BF36E
MRLILRSVLAGAAVAFALLLLLHWPTRDSDSELKLLSAFALAPFPLSLVAAWLARLSPWPLVGMLAPFAMLAVAFLQPDYGSWTPDENLPLYLFVAVPATTGFVVTALICAWLMSEAKATG